MSLKRPYGSDYDDHEDNYGPKHVNFGEREEEMGRGIKRPFVGDDNGEFVDPKRVRIDEADEDRPRTFSLLFRNNSKFLVCGPSQAGKSCFVLNFLRYGHLLFEDPRCLQNVIFFYNREQDGYDYFKDENIVHEWRKELPTSDLVAELAEPYRKIGGSVMVIDDFGQDLKEDTAKIFTQVAHHSKVTIFLLQQNLYSQV